MSCARIRNKPMKFLDPQEKLIIDLKEEIRRLRNENKKLRNNLLSAPTSGDKMSHGHGHGQGHTHLSHLSDDERSATAEGYSTHSALDRQRLKFKPKNGGAVYPARMHISPSDYMKKKLALSPLRGSKGSNGGYGSPDRALTQAESLEMLDTMRAAITASKRELEAHQLQQGQGQGQGQGRRSKEGYEDDDFEEEEEEGDNQSSATGHRSAGGGGSLGSVGRSPSWMQREAGASIDAVMQRRASGPMILRGHSGADLTLAPVRETASTGYAPAQNLQRTMDAHRIEELEKRIARMESGVLAAQQVNANGIPLTDQQYQQQHQKHQQQQHYQPHASDQPYLQQVQPTAGGAGGHSMPLRNFEEQILAQAASATGHPPHASPAKKKKKKKGAVHSIGIVSFINLH
jgi:hypothetical protein